MYGFAIPWSSTNHGELLIVADLFQLDFIKAQAAFKIAHNGLFTEENYLLICQVFCHLKGSKVKLSNKILKELEKLGMSADNLRLKAAKYVMEEVKSNIEWRKMTKLNQLMAHFWKEAKEARMVRIKIKWKENIGRI